MAKVKVKTKSIEEIKISGGVREGYVISPLLFNIYTLRKKSRSRGRLWNNYK